VIVASDVRVAPVLSSADIGRVTIDDPCNVTVASQRGQADVLVGSESHSVEEGKAYRVHAVNEISYHQWVSPDVDKYHEYHSHKPCAPVQMVQGHSPIAAGQSRFMLVTGLVAGGLSYGSIGKSDSSLRDNQTLPTIAGFCINHGRRRFHARSIPRNSWRPRTTLAFCPCSRGDSQFRQSLRPYFV
jgi:hypothetical protein